MLILKAISSSKTTTNTPTPSPQYPSNPTTYDNPVDSELVEKILLFIKDKVRYNNNLSVNDLTVLNYPLEKIAYHLKFLSDAGYIEIMIIGSGTNQDCLIKKITFQGHQYIKNISIYEDEEKVIYSKISGVTFNNDDGTSRQELLELCEVGDELILEHTPTEKHPTAVSIFNESYEQLGFVKSDLSEKVMDWLLEDRIISVTIEDLTGGTPDKPTIGCNYKILLDDSMD